MPSGRDVAVGAQRDEADPGGGERERDHLERPDPFAGQPHRSAIVNTTCVCTIRDASPGEMNPFMAMNSSPNWPAPISRP